MKCLMVLLLAFLSLVSAAETEDQRTNMIFNVSRMFKITKEQAEHCVLKTEVLYEDLQNFESSLMEDVEVDKDSVRRATCMIACAGQALGTMDGARLNMEKIHELLGKGKAPDSVMSKYHIAVDKCEKLVRDIADDCNVAKEFIKCLITKLDI